MGMTLRDTLQLACGARLPVIRATSRHMAALYPFQAESGLVDLKTGRKIPGIPHGFCGRDDSGGIFYFDEVMLYQAGILTNTNVKVFGEIGQRKSACLKTHIRRGVQIGYNHLVTDVKGEYTILAEHTPGAKILRFGAGAGLYISPLDAAISPRVQEQLIRAMALKAMGANRTALSVFEQSLIWAGIRAVKTLHTVPLLPHLVDCLFEPTKTMVEDLHLPFSEIKNRGYDLALGLQRLTVGDLAGMFDKPTTPGLLQECPLLVLNCENLVGDLRVIMVILINFFTQSQWGGDNPKHRFHKIFHDESWDLASDPTFVESIRSAFKLGGTKGISNWIVAHHMSNLMRSASSEAIQDLIADSETTIHYKQDRKELDNSQVDLGLSRTEINRIVDLRPGTALWKIAELPAIEVRQHAWPGEREFFETRHLLKGQEIPQKTKTNNIP